MFGELWAAPWQRSPLAWAALWLRSPCGRVLDMFGMGRPMAAAALWLRADMCSNDPQTFRKVFLI